MNDPAELLALLACRGVDMTGANVRGTVPVLSAQDVAAAMGMGHDPLGAEMLMAKFALDDSALRSASVRWFMVIGDRALRQRWDRGTPGTMKRMADWTMREYVDPNRCKTCHGAEVMIAKLLRTCPACEGSGLRDPSEKAIARDLGIDLTEYRRLWSERLAWSRRELYRLDYAAMEALRDALREERV